MLGTVGASVGLAGLLLVFSGFVFGQAASFPPETTDNAIIDKFRNAGKFGLWPFLIAVLDSLSATAWLVHPSAWLYSVAVFGFFLVLIATGIYGAVLLKFYL